MKLLTLCRVKQEEMRSVGSQKQATIKAMKVSMNRKCRFPRDFTMAMVLRIEMEMDTVESE